MAQTKDEEFASTEARAAVSSLYRKLRDDAVRFALLVVQIPIWSK